MNRLWLERKEGWKEEGMRLWEELGGGSRQKKRKSNVTYGSQLIPAQEGGELSQPAGKLLVTSNWSEWECLDPKN